MDEHLAKRFEGFDGLTEEDRGFVENKPVWTGHQSSPDEEGYRRDLLALCESIAIADGATRKKTGDDEEGAVAPAAVDTLALVLSSRAYLDRRSSEFQAFGQQVQLAREVGTGQFLRMMSASDALSAGRLDPLLVESLDEDAQMFLPLTDGDMDHARRWALSGRMRGSIGALLDSIAEFEVEEAPGRVVRIYVFERLGFLALFSDAVKSLARGYGLLARDVPALVLEGRPARLAKGSFSVKRHSGSGALDRVTLDVPAHASPDLVAALFATVRDARGRPRLLGKRNAALVEMRARLALETGLDDLDALYERWNDDPGVPDGWRFRERFRFNAALEQADGGLLRREPVSPKRMARAFRLLDAGSR